MTLAPGAYLVVFASEKDRVVPDSPLHTNFKLAETGEYLALVKPDGTTIVQQFSPSFPLQLSGISYSSSGYLTTPTPGAENSALAGPLITVVTENPLPPSDADDVPIQAMIVAQGGATVTSAMLIYRVMYGAEVSVPMTTTGGGLYAATIPAAASAPGQMIRWRITAGDSAARTSKVPFFSDPVNSPEYFGSVVQDTSITSQLPVIQRFVQNAANIDNDPGTRCSLFYNGEFFDNLAIRIRGYTSRSWPKKSHKIEMNPGYHFQFKAGVPRVSEFNLNTTYTDKSYVRAVLASEIQRAIGMASPEIFPVRVRQNGAFYSVALFTENPDEDFLKRNGIDPDGAFYKAPTANTYETSATFEKKSRLYEAGKADLDAHITALGLTGTALETYVFDHVDLPGMVNYIATTCITQNIDACDKNHFAYRDIAPWPIQANGNASLVLIAPLTHPDPGLPQNWRASMTAIGNPAADDAVHFTGTANADDDGDGWVNLIEYAFGTNPVISATRPPGGLTLTAPRVSNADDAVAGAEVSTNLQTWIPAEIISNSGGTLTFRAPPALLNEPRLFIRAVARFR